MSNKVIVVDNAISHLTISGLLINEGFRVDVVHNADAGLQLLATQVYDVIILQENPEAESWQLCEAIRQQSRLPLIIISPNASAATCVKAINAGADYFLRKPFGPLEFLARVQSLLQRTSLRQMVPIDS